MAGLVRELIARSCYLIQMRDKVVILNIEIEKFSILILFDHISKGTSSGAC